MIIQDETFCLMVSLRCPERAEALLAVLPESRREPLAAGIAEASGRPRDELRGRLARLAAARSAGAPAGPRVLARYLAARSE